MSTALPFDVRDAADKELRDQVQQNFYALASVGGNFGGKSVEVRFGSGSVTFTASTTSSTVNISHGLGRVPASISLTPITAAAIGVTVKAAPTATSFDAQAFCTTAVTGPLTFYWVAFG